MGAHMSFEVATFGEALATLEMWTLVRSFSGMTPVMNFKRAGPEERCPADVAHKRSSRVKGVVSYLSLLCRLMWSFRCPCVVNRLSQPGIVQA